MESVLVVSSDKKSTEYLYDLLRDEQLSIIESAESISEIHGHYDLIIIDIPLKSGLGGKTAAELFESTDSKIVLAVPKEREEYFESKSEKYGVFVIAKPVDKYLFRKTMHFFRAMQKTLGGVQKENVRLKKQIDDIRLINRAKYILMEKKQIDDIRLINRAKYILMEYLSMTEAQAHRYLEKQAMDMRVTKAEVAKSILSTYEN